MKLQNGNHRTKRLSRVDSGMELAPPSSGSRTVAIFGQGSSRTRVGRSSEEWRSLSIRSSQRSKDRDDMDAISSKCGNDAITATIEGLRAFVSIDIGSFMVTAHQEQSKVNDRRPSAIMGRRQELNLQLNQLIDAVILVLCLWGAHTIRVYLGDRKSTRLNSSHT